MRTAKDLICSLDLIAPKNPKNDWSKICRSIVDDTIEYIENHEKTEKSLSSVYDKIDAFGDALLKMKDDRDFFGSKLDKERWETITAVIELFGEFFPDRID